ncbi:hypothetical protein L914_02740 [Phytophthora nicotianae]|uniref:Uncharacterized protein n=1 Tax=Phytophthora nicotianae TaxID=4792 RepID=W2NYK9_PHYNI|nr:hypothetical protein L914_02740 [Phytophthora nicotianae]
MHSRRRDSLSYKPTGVRDRLQNNYLLVYCSTSTSMPRTLNLYYRTEGAQVAALSDCQLTVRNVVKTVSLALRNSRSDSHIAHVFSNTETSTWLVCHSLSATGDESTIHLSHLSLVTISLPFNSKVHVCLKG